MSRPNRSGFRHAADGTPLAFEYSDDDVSFTVPIQLPAEHEDSLEDQAREALAEGRSITDFVAEMVRRFEQENAQRLKAEVLKLTLSEILSSENPAMSAWALAFACNLHLLQGVTQPEIARRFNVRKQALHQLIKKHRAALGLTWVQVPNMRSAEARAKMRARNYRHDGS